MRKLLLVSAFLLVAAAPPSKPKTPSEIITEAPGWPQAGVMAKAIGARLVEVARDEARLRRVYAGLPVEVRALDAGTPAGASRASEGSSVIAVAPLPITSTRLPA